MFCGRGKKFLQLHISNGDVSSYFSLLLLQLVMAFSGSASSCLCQLLAQRSIQGVGRPSDSLESSGAILRPRSPCQTMAHLSIWLTLCPLPLTPKIERESISSSFKDVKSCAILGPRSACQAYLPVRLGLCSFLPIPSVQLLVVGPCAFATSPL